MVKLIIRKYADSGAPVLVSLMTPVPILYHTGFSYDFCAKSGAPVLVSLMTSVPILYHTGFSCPRTDCGLSSQDSMDHEITHGGFIHWNIESTSLPRQQL